MKERRQQLVPRIGLLSFPAFRISPDSPQQMLRMEEAQGPVSDYQLEG